MIVKIAVISYIIGCLASLITCKLAFKEEMKKHYNEGYNKGYKDAEEIRDYFK